MFCRLMQWNVSRRLDDRRPLGRFTAQHVDACARCRQFHDRATALGNKLRAGAVHSPAPAFEGVYDAPLPENRASGWSRGRRPFALMASGLIAAAATVLVIVVANPSDEPNGPSEAETQTIPKPALAQWTTASKRLETRATALFHYASLDPSVDRSIGHSLDREIENLAQDARSGLRYVLRVGGLK